MKLIRLLFLVLNSANYFLGPIQLNPKQSSDYLGFAAPWIEKNMAHGVQLFGIFHFRTTKEISHLHSLSIIIRYQRYSCIGSKIHNSIPKCILFGERNLSTLSKNGDCVKFCLEMWSRHTQLNRRKLLCKCSL